MEDLIKANTAALIALTEAIYKMVGEKPEIGGAPFSEEEIQVHSELMELHAHRAESKALAAEPVPRESILGAVPEKDNVEVDYQTTKDLIGKLALNHRDAIKALNAKYDLKVFADILVDKNDIAKGVKDEDILWNYYTELKALDN